MESMRLRSLDRETCFPERETKSQFAVLQFANPQFAKPWDEYSFSFRYRVVLPIPRRRAASSLSPFSLSMVPKIVCFSNSAIGIILEELSVFPEEGLAS